MGETGGAMSNDSGERPAPVKEADVRAYLEIGRRELGGALVAGPAGPPAEASALELVARPVNDRLEVPGGGRVDAEAGHAELYRLGGRPLQPSWPPVQPRQVEVPRVTLHGPSSVPGDQDVVRRPA